MSGLSTRDARKLMEAYAEMYAPQQENLSEEVEQIDEIAVNFGGQAALAAKQKELAQQKQSDARISALRTQRFGSGGSPSAKGSGGTRYGTGSTYSGARPSTAAPTRPAAPAAPARPAASAPAARPATPAAKPAAAKPATTKPAGSAMDQWKANFPKLAAKVTPAGTQKGTGQSTMAKQAAELRSLRPATPTQATAAAPSTSAAASGSVAPATAAIAKKPTQPTVAPGGAKKPWMEELDAYDVVLEYLLNNGHVDNVDEAHYVMLEMNSEAIQDIVEARKSYSAKAARAGEDIGKPGKGFEKIATEAGKRYGSKERGEKVAGAVLAGLRKKHG